VGYKKHLIMHLTV